MHDIDNMVMTMNKMVMSVNWLSGLYNYIRMIFAKNPVFAGGGGAASPLTLVHKLLLPRRREPIFSPLT